MLKIMDKITCFESAEKKSLDSGGATLFDCYDATLNVPAAADAAILKYGTTSNATISEDHAKPNASNGASC